MACAGPPTEATDLVLRHTRLEAPPACPEVRLRLAADMVIAWEMLETAAGPAGVPFWAVAWVGGQALARYLLDNPQIVAGRCVIDIGSGSGLCAIAAALAGAKRVLANEIDRLAQAAIALNATISGVELEVVGENLIGSPLPDRPLVLAADLWYERSLAARVTPWLDELHREGLEVLLGDKRRHHFPRVGVETLASYDIATPESLEPTQTTRASVWRFLSIRSMAA